MGNTHSDTGNTRDKIQSIDNSISHLIGCVKHLESIRSHDYLASVDEEDIEKVIAYMQRLEESIEKLNNSPKTQPSPRHLLKAVGKNKRLWVTKPTDIYENKKTSKDQTDSSVSRPESLQPKTTGNVIFNSKNLDNTDNTGKPARLFFKQK